MKVRKTFLFLLCFGLLMLGLDASQRWVYVNRAPRPESLIERGKGQDLTYSLLVAGGGLDRAELATGLRDLATAKEAILRSYPGAHKMRTLYPGQADYSGLAFADAVRQADGCERLIVYLTGHGGGFNFGAVGDLNLSYQEIYQSLLSIHCDEAILVVDCCWSGVFADKLSEFSFPYPLTLVTSTDAEHPSPFPVSFLSPRSYGATWFEHLGSGEHQAYEATNAVREKWSRFYPAEMGLKGTWTVAGP